LLYSCTAFCVFVCVSTNVVRLNKQTAVSGVEAVSASATRIWGIIPWFCGRICICVGEEKKNIVLLEPQVCKCVIWLTSSIFWQRQEVCCNEGYSWDCGLLKNRNGVSLVIRLFFFHWIFLRQPYYCLQFLRTGNDRVFWSFVGCLKERTFLFQGGDCFGKRLCIYD